MKSGDGLKKWKELSEEDKREAVRPFVVRQRVCPFTAEELVRWAILTTLFYYKGNRTFTAMQLNLSIRTIRNHIRKYAKAGFYVPAARGA